MAKHLPNVDHSCNGSGTGPNLHQVGKPDSGLNWETGHRTAIGNIIRSDTISGTNTRGLCCADTTTSSFPVSDGNSNRIGKPSMWCGNAYEPSATAHSHVRLLGMMMVATSLLTACSDTVSVGPGAVAGLTPDATVEMEEVQVAYLGSAGGGSGTLFYQGQAYPFQIGGLGVGGIGASTIDATGEVYKLSNIYRFPGAYAEARYGLAVGNLSTGDLWLQNETGVIMHLKARRTGLMLSLGGDAVVITMQQ